MVRALVLCSLMMTVLGGIVAAQETTGATPAASGAMDFVPLVIMLAAFGLIFYFMLIRPQRKRQQQMNELLGGLKRGDKVVTAGGIHGEIDSLGDTSVVLLLEEGAKLRMAKASIVRKLDK
ncbi:MAG: preprotein translocase subunit YajC [Candidatus Bipolaricaulota bacterium]